MSYQIKNKESINKTCACCGEPVTVVQGDILNTTGEEMGWYLAELPEHSKESWFPLAILIDTIDRGVCLAAVPGQGFHVLDSHPTLPPEHFLTRIEALEHPDLDSVFQLADFIVANDSRVAARYRPWGGLGCRISWQPASPH